MDVLPTNKGWIEVVIGTMFGGKSTELLRRLERALIANLEVIAFSKDSRFRKGSITTHNEMALKGHYVENAAEMHAILEENPTVDVIGIDEIQFFGELLVPVCRTWALAGKRIVCAGLDQDHRGDPFETTMALVSEAEYVQKMLAICCKCGTPAVKNHLKVKSESRIVEGTGDLYEALCRDCHRIISG